MSSRPQRVTARAPGRVNLIGEHTDYNDGFVLPMALPFVTTLVAQARPDRVVNLESIGFPSTTFGLDDDPSQLEPWARYVGGMLKLLAEEGLPISGFDGQISTNIPVGASLSSSAALEVATGFAMYGLADADPDPVHVAKIGQRVENEIIGIQSGIMDQLISAIAVDGTVTQIDCRSLDATAVTLPIDARVVIMDTMTRRELADSEYDLRREACVRAAAALGVSSLRDAALADVVELPDGIDKQRAHHVVTENARVLATVSALADNDLATVGELMNESHQSLSVDYEVSSVALDEMSQIARDTPGCFGARMTGGGFAGSAVALVHLDSVDQLVTSVGDEWWRRNGVQPDIWAVGPSAGASVAPTPAT